MTLTADAQQAGTRTPTLSLRSISKSFGDFTAVKDVSFDLHDGEVVGLIGENGAGKSSLLKILAGVYRPDGGSIEVSGRQVKFRGPHDALVEGIGVVHQEQSLYGNLSVAENIALSSGPAASSAVRLGFFRWKQVNERAARLLSQIGSKLDPRTKVGDLTFIDRQMVEIARAISVGEGKHQRSIVILDEPTSLLEPHETDVLEREITKLRALGSVIFVSHRLDEVMRICDRILVMREGQLVATRRTDEVDQAELFRLMVGRPEQSTKRDYRRVPEPGEAPVVELQGLSKRGRFKDLDLRFMAGEITVVVGTNGSGREELCRALFGVDRADSGSLLVKGEKVSGWTVPKAIAAGFGFVPSERKVEGMAGGLTAASNLTLVFDEDAKVGPVLVPAKQKAVAAEWFERLDVRPRNVGLELERFSGGNQQKVVMAKWLKSEELSLLILDHPLRGLDPGAAATVNALIRRVVEQDTAVVLLADTLHEALEMGDQIVVMRDGEVTAVHDLHTEQPTSLDLLEKML
jgi:ribose transport system ATP-binding protein